MKTIIIEADTVFEVIESYKDDEKALYILGEVFIGNDELFDYIARLYNLVKAAAHKRRQA